MPLICRLLAVIYSNIEAQVCWNGIDSDKFRITNGVKQGGVMSPLLFNFYTESLISRIVGSSMGCRVGNVSAAILMYADDIALLAPSRGAMQHLLDISCQYGKEFKLSFNAQKSECIVFGGETPQKNLMLENNSIPYVNKIKYLGHNLQNKSINTIFNLDPVVSDILSF